VDPKPLLAVCAVLVEGTARHVLRKSSLESAFSEQALRYTPISGLLIGASRSVLSYFLPSLTTSLFCISHSIQP
jgi:hypothetical protein